MSDNRRFAASLLESHTDSMNNTTPPPPHTEIAFKYGLKRLRHAAVIDGHVKHNKYWIIGRFVLCDSLVYQVAHLCCWCVVITWLARSLA